MRLRGNLILLVRHRERHSSFRPWRAHRMANEALKIENIEFAVTSQIGRAPHWTMIRELTMNAIEAASRATGDKNVLWTTGKYQSHRKAVIWNTGPGMDAGELKKATDLACEIGKKLGLDDNFGVGAKVSSLPNNKLGMRMRSCKNGRVSEVIIGQDPDTGTYVRFERDLPGGGTDTVIDVTAIAKTEGRDNSVDWTEVMLLGNSLEQDTAAKPLASVPTTEKSFIANTLYRRFYRLPEGVKLRLDYITASTIPARSPLLATGMRNLRDSRAFALKIGMRRSTFSMTPVSAISRACGNRQATRLAARRPRYSRQREGSRLPAFQNR